MRRFEDLRSIFGVNSRAMHDRALGIDERLIETERIRKSVSHERTFADDLTTRAEIEDAIDYVGSLVGRQPTSQAARGTYRHAQAAL